MFYQICGSFDSQESLELFKVTVLAPQLQGGHVVIAGASGAVFIPSGWNHCVFTIRGGFLIGRTFTALNHLESLVRCFGKEVTASTQVENLIQTAEMIIYTSPT